MCNCYIPEQWSRKLWAVAHTLLLIDAKMLIIVMEKLTEYSALLPIALQCDQVLPAESVNLGAVHTML
jgi:hypothetical protein